MNNLSDFINACGFTADLRHKFKDVADLLGPVKAFYAFATPIVQAGLDQATEERFIRIVRALYDDYVGSPA